MSRTKFTGNFVLALKSLGQFGMAFWKTFSFISHPVSEFYIEIAKCVHFQIFYCIPTNGALSFSTAYLYFAKTKLQFTSAFAKLRPSFPFHQNLGEGVQIRDH